MLEKAVIIAISFGYWGKGPDLETAVANARKEGARATDPVLLYLFTGPETDVWVDDGGALTWKQTGTVHHITDKAVVLRIPPRK
jgi:hypothetical protein